MGLTDKVGMKDEQMGDFPSSSRVFLNALYAGQKTPPKTDDEKIEVIRKIIDNGFTPDSFDTIEQLRKAYEFYYLTKVGILD